MDSLLKRARAEINIDNLLYNYRNIKQRVNNKTVMCVVKADGYGHGAEVLSLELQKEGASFFAVSNIDEALSLREAGIKGEILILGATPPCLAEVLCEKDFSQAVFSEEFAKELSSELKSIGKKLKVHIKIDTGMSRIGFYGSSEEIAKSILKGAVSEQLSIEGLFAHFAVADSSLSKNESYTRAQSDKFFKVLDILKKEGLSPKYIHHCNSAGLVNYDDERYTAYRAGIILYGLLPDRDEKLDLEIRPLMEVKSYVSMVKEVDAGVAVSYGCTFVANKKTTLATIPMGYADGYIRDFSNKAEVIINGKRARVCGRVCMDQFLVDATGIDVKAGDEAVLIGKGGGEYVSADELSEIAQTINYETVCLIGKRVPRVYTKDNKIFAVMKDISKVVY